jgi:hypothetical protein
MPAMDEVPPPSRRWVKVLIVALPLWIAVSGAVGLYLFLRSERIATQTPDFQITRDIEGERLMSDLRKLTMVVGERNFRTEETRKHLRSAAKMIEGSLSPQNTGFRVNRTTEEVAFDQQWSIYWVEIKGKKATEEVVWLFAGYDSPLSSSGTELNATGVAALLALGQSLATATPDRTIRIAFLPHANEENSPLTETARIFNKTIVEAGGRPVQVLHVKGMGNSDRVLTSAKIPLTGQELKPYQISAEFPEAPAEDINSLLKEWDLPVADVSTAAVPGESRIGDLPDPDSFERAVKALRVLVLDLATL